MIDNYFGVGMNVFPFDSKLSASINRAFDQAKACSESSKIRIRTYKPIPGYPYLSPKIVGESP